jgi:hypothetical protein
MVKLQSLISYVVSELQDMGASFGKTKLVKLVYLIDVENYRIRGEKLTGVNWVFYYYGPYITDIDDTLRKLDLYIAEEETTTATQHRVFVYKGHWDAEKAFLEETSSLEQSLVKRVLKKWALEDLNPILSYVYFHTEPMQDAERGDILDFSKIRRRPLDEHEKEITKPNAEHLKAIRERLKRVQTERVKHMARELEPKPRFDEIFWQGVTNMDSEEYYAVPSGNIQLDEESKEQFRGQSEK